MHKNANFELFLSNSFYGNGYAKEARFLMLKYAFYERGLLRITDYVNEKNVNTLRLNYTNANEETIKEGIKRLAQSISEI